MSHLRREPTVCCWCCLLLESVVCFLSFAALVRQPSRPATAAGVILLLAAYSSKFVDVIVVHFHVCFDSAIIITGHALSHLSLKYYKL